MIFLCRFLFFIYHMLPKIDPSNTLIQYCAHGSAICPIPRPHSSACRKPRVHRTPALPSKPPESCFRNVDWCSSVWSVAILSRMSTHLQVFLKNRQYCCKALNAWSSWMLTWGWPGFERIGWWYRLIWWEVFPLSFWGRQCKSQSGGPDLELFVFIFGIWNQENGFWGEI